MSSRNLRTLGKRKPETSRFGPPARLAGAGAWSAVLLAMAFPTLLTVAYFVVLTGFSSGVQQAVYGIGKVIQFAFPVVCVYLIERRRGPIPLARPSGLGIGIGFGLLVVLLMALLYFSWLKPSVQFEMVQRMVEQKITDLGLHSTGRYMALGLFYSLFHSLLEEYYWRWFVFDQLRRLCSTRSALVLSSLGFMAHHVVLLATFFGWDSPLSYLFAAAVGIGGGVWAWMYHRTDSLLGPWLSHMLIDAAIFLIGFDMVRSGLQAS